MTLAKGITSGYLPLSAVMVGDGIADVLFREGGEFAHGFTYSGHPVACAVALANIEIMEREGLVDKVREETGPYFQARLRELAQHPLVGEVRGVGLLGGIEMVADIASRRPFDDPGKAGVICREACFANNVISRSVGDSMVLSPPLVIAKDEIDELMKRMRKSLDQTRNALEAA
jgi:putrescine aminotransferase